MSLPILYTIISILTAGIGINLAVRSYQKQNLMGKLLCHTCIGATLANLSYLLSIFTTQYFAMSLLTSIYFISIDGMLYCLLHFVHIFTRQPDTPHAIWVKRFLTIYLVCDVSILLINPFKEIAVYYVYRGGSIGAYMFAMKPLYYGHLAYTYFLVVLSLFRLLQKVFHTPSVYRRQYMFTVESIVLVVLYNALFLYSSRSTAFDFLDYSVWGYSFCAFFLYWNCFNYSTHGMLNYFRTWILESVNQGIVLFDYEDNLLAKNENATSLFPAEAFEEGTSLQKFLEECRIQPDNLLSDSKHSFQCFKRNGEIFAPIRCDYQALKSDSNERLGRLFVFTDNSYELDLLTGFHNWDYFHKIIKTESKNIYPFPVSVAVCDINGLQTINDTLGRNTGDRALALLAGLLRKHFPPETYFIRGHEAAMIALCIGIGSEDIIQECLDKVRKEYNAITELNYFLDIQSSVSSLSSTQQDPLTAVQIAIQGMKAKKLLDKNSTHSELMTSLVCALQECDHDTEAHVQRTQIIGNLLAERLNLTDIQKSNLSLLCVLHDIGKIGIPLDILNKPGKLTDAEWAVLKTHVEKGYQIVKSSQELSGIADMVRYHHERWDGKGYPDGLSGEEIPLLSRIISVVDAYDAMVNDRSYRSAIPSEKAIAELKRCSGTQFDPQIVQEFCALIDSNPEIINLAVHSEFTASRSAVEGPAAASNNGPTLQNTIHQIKFTRYILDGDSAIISADENFEDLTGYTHADYTEHVLKQSDLIFPSERTEYLTLVSEQLSSKSLAFFEHRLRKKDGSAIYVFCFGRLFYDSATRSSRSEIIATDSSNTFTMRTVINNEYARALDLMPKPENSRGIDSLTGLPALHKYLKDVGSILRKGAPPAIMLILDIDHFQDYIDTYGHHAGDVLLILTGQTLKSMLKENEVACRRGGDTFSAILFCGKDETEQALFIRAQQLFHKLNLTLSSQGDGASLSMGMARTAQGLTTFQQLYEASEKALEDAKQIGFSTLSVYSE